MTIKTRMMTKTTMAIAVAAMAAAHIFLLPRGAQSFLNPTTTPHRRCCRRNDDGKCHPPHRIPTIAIAERRRGGGGRIANRNRRSGRGGGGGGGGEVYDDGDMEEEDASGTARPVLVAADDVIDVSLDDRGRGIRLNKVFKATHSRRTADELIRSGRVCVNGVVMMGSRDDAGTRVVPYRDVVTLDGVVVRGWEVMNAVVPVSEDDDDDGDDVNIDVDRAMSYVVGAEGDGEEIARDGDDRGHRRRLILRRTTSSFEYVKYHKPTGVTCTTDPRIKDNIVDSIRRSGYVPRHRVYPVGRLDRETSGLILLTSDGRVVNSVLRGERKQPKVYEVRVDGTLRDDDIRRLRDGIVIRTVAQRKGRSEAENTLVAKTRPCSVTRIGPDSCRMTLVEGRNRQIRKMMEALGHAVVRLHRIEFMGIRLSSSGGGGGEGSSLRQPGDWAYLDENEMRLVEDALWSAAEKM